MNIALPFECVISIRESGSNNAARILGEGITASSTNSAQIAAETAVAKLVKRNRWPVVNIEINKTSRSQNFSMWLAKISERK